MTADARCLLNQVNLKTRSGKIKGGLDTADAATNDHHIAKFTVRETSAKLFNLFFFQFFMPFPVGAKNFSPLQVPYNASCMISVISLISIFSSTPMVILLSSNMVMQ